MTINDKLLKEAIADAKAVKEVAIANAMLTLKETFRPQFTEMLASKLREEEMTEVEEDVNEQKKLDSSGIGGGAVTVDDPGPKMPADAARSSSDIENKGLEVDTFGEGIGDLGGHKEDDEVDVDMVHEPGHEGEDALDMHMGQEPGQGPEMGQGHDPMDGQHDDLDLEAIIRELEAEIAAGQQEHEIGMPTEKVSYGEGDPHATPIGAASVKKESFAKNIQAGNDINAGLQVEDKAKGDETSGGEGFGKGGLPRNGDEGIHKDGRDISDTEGVPGGKKVSETVTEVDEEVDLDEIVREIAAEDKVVEAANIAAQNAELQRSLREHREVIKLLRNRINEVTLLNSKLMYTTKIFRNFNLSEGQKRKIVEQFDRASTLREAKLIFSTLAESLGGPVGASSTKKNTIKSLTEGASAAMKSTKPSKETQQKVLTEGTTQAERWQKLAGIIRS